MDDVVRQRIGILDFTGAGWTAGATFTRTLTWSLTQACRQNGSEALLLTENEDTLTEHKLPIPIVRVPAPLMGSPAPVSRSFRQRLLHRILEPPASLMTYNVYKTASEHGISVLLPPGTVPDWTAGIKTIGWIPDFQHIHLPQYFTEAERCNRTRMFRNLAERAEAVFLSSHNSHEHFCTFAPEYVKKAHVLSFPSLFAFEPLYGDPVEICRKYNLPDKFALVANQFWAHKNHELVVEGLRLLHTKGVRIPVVMTGLPIDHRDADNRLLSRLLQAVAMGNVSSQVVLLGAVPREDLIGLMRVAALVVQPSRFEGWSTVVQDAKALGRPVLCSDIPVHHEQAPSARGFFRCNEPAIFAEQMASIWDRLEPGPNIEAEQKALADERAFAADHGQRLLQICHSISQ